MVLITAKCDFFQDFQPKIIVENFFFMTSMTLSMTYSMTYVRLFYCLVKQKKTVSQKLFS